MGLSPLIGMIFSGLARCAWHQLSIAKAIVALIKVEEDDMIEFGIIFSPLKCKCHIRNKLTPVPFPQLCNE